MAIPKLKRQDILNALKFIDENGVPEQNVSTKYMLVSEDGNKYPPKYVVAVAGQANGVDISTEDFNSTEAKNYLSHLGFTIEAKQKKYVLTITAESVVSTDERFTMDDLSSGENYKPLDVYFKKANGDIPTVFSIKKISSYIIVSKYLFAQTSNAIKVLITFSKFTHQ